MKTKRLLLGIAISTLLLGNCSKENNNIDDCAGCSLVNYNTIDEFFEENGVPTQDFSVDGANGGSITGDQGTIITFQPNSFLDQNGTAVTGKR